MGSIRDIGTDVINSAGEVEKIADDTVVSADIVDGTIVTADIADGAVTTAKLASPTLRVLEETVLASAFDDSGANTVGFIDLSSDLPAGAIVTRTAISALTGFAGDTSATIQIGDGSTAARYSTGTPDVFTTAAFIDAGVVSGTPYNLTAVTPRVTVTTNSDFTSAVAGGGVVTISIYYYEV